MGYSAIMSQAMTAPPYLFSFCIVLFITRLSDKYRSRGLYVSISASFAAFGYISVSVAGALKSPNLVRYVFIFPACAGFFTAITLIITWNLNNQESAFKKGIALSLMNVIGQCGPLIGARLYPRSDGPFYVRGMAICAAFMVGAFLLSIILRHLLVKENEKLEQSYNVEVRADEQPLVSQHDTIPQSYSYKYVT